MVAYLSDAVFKENYVVFLKELGKLQLSRVLSEDGNPVFIFKSF